ncbi:MAG: nucleotidyltransferase substrate binding protein [Magnetococcales bacterium]|nr:nucleotidyltransferase substrate binding protein [Magnetococcales bacterium]
MIDYTKFRMALRHLQRQHENLRHLDPDLPELMREAVAESVIQRFEICYDCLWKVLKRYVQEELGVPEVPNSPKPIFRMAHENALLPSPVERWLSYAEARINTSHDYSGGKAGECLEGMGAFIDDASALLQTLSGEDEPC